MSPVYRIDVNGVKAQILPARPGAARHGKPAVVEIPEIVLFRAGILNLWVTKTPAADGRALTSDGFGLYWRWKSRRRTGRTPTDRELIELIRRMWRANPTWGSRRIQAELAKLGLQVCAATIRKYRPKGERGPPSQTWRAFLRNHTKQLVAVDFFTVPTVTFRVLFVFVVLALERRKVLHFAVTEAPSAIWAGQQVVNAFPFAVPPKYLLRDRDGVYGADFTKRVAALGIKEKLIAPHAPWQNPYAERLIGTIRRECLDQVIVIGERHLQRVLKDYFDYYQRSRPHRSLTRFLTASSCSKTALTAQCASAAQS